MFSNISINLSHGTTSVHDSSPKPVAYQGFENHSHFTIQSTITPYPFQTDVILDIHRAIAGGKKSITLAAATGAGKTVIGGQLKIDFLSLSRSVLFVVHRDVLVGQTVRTLQKFGITPGIIAGGYPENRFAKVQVASVQTLARRNIDWFRWDVVIFDEGHITSWSHWGRQTLKSLGDRHAIHLTATPFRLSKKESFSQISDCLVKAPSMLELIQMGRLSKPRYLVAGEVDVSGVKVKRGEFSSDELSVLCDNPAVTARFIEALHTYAKGRLTLAFCVGVNHAKHVAEVANENGIPSAYVDGEMSRGQRQELYEALAEGRIRLLASCEALAEGFDVPSVDCIALLRPSQSKSKYMQHVGRGLRFFPGKEDCLILCQSGNVKRFGFVEDIEIEFDSFEDKPSQPAPTKTCGLWDEDLNYWSPGVGCSSEIHASLMTCPHCGYEFPSKDDEKIRLIGEFKELVPNWQKGYYERFCVLLDECLDKRWHPYKAIAEYRAAHPKNYKPSYSWLALWVSDRAVTEDVVRSWFLAVEGRKGDGTVIAKWMPRFLPVQEVAS